MELRRTSFSAIGTSWQVDLPAVLPAQEEQIILAAVHQRIAAFDLQYSRFRPDSWVSTVAQQAGTYTIPADGQPLFDTYKDLHQLTAGAFTPFIGQTLVEAGYDAKYSLQTKELTPTPAWNAERDYQFPQITLPQPTLLDVGAAGKGYLVDLVSQVIREHGVQDYCVDAGGDIVRQATDSTTLRVGLEDPREVTRVIGVVNLAQGSLCGSAGNRRAWGEFHHIIDPHTQQSPRHVLATWTTASSALIADALATCLFFVPAATLKAHYEFEHLVLQADGAVTYSSGFPAELF